MSLDDISARRQPAWPDWRDPAQYAVLARANRRAFAWEWLRRTGAYRRAWEASRGGVAAHITREFGLERFEDPYKPVPIARPLWSVAVDPSVLDVHPQDLFAPAIERLDLLKVSELVSLSVDDGGVEHILLSDGTHFVRLDVYEATLLGCPSTLLFKIVGPRQARTPLAGLDQLITLAETGNFDAVDIRRSRRYDRWIMELRTADALTHNATSQDIAHCFFGDAIPSSRWRATASSYRQRIQRLIKNAHSRLATPTDRRWFEG